MRALTVTAVVHPDHTLTVEVPPDIPCGAYEVVVVINSPPSPPSPAITEWRLPAHDVGPVDPRMTYRREDMYGDDGR